jgi:hypothetical protein
LTKLYVEAIPATVNGKMPQLAIAQSYGSSFHLLQLGLMHALTGNVKGIEVYRVVPVFRNAKSAEDGIWKNTEHFPREVDIVLGGRTDDDREETWWELKSWKAVSLTNREPAQSSKTWTFLKGKKDDNGDLIEDSVDEAEIRGESHKQFCLDRIAVNNGARLSKKEAKAKSLGDKNDYEEPPIIKVSDFNWQFHKFRAGKKKDIISPTKPELEKRFVKDPKGNDDTFKAQRVKNSTARSSINLGATEELMEFLKEEGYTLADEALNDITIIPE